MWNVSFGSLLCSVSMQKQVSVWHCLLMFVFINVFAYGISLTSGIFWPTSSIANQLITDPALFIFRVVYYIWMKKNSGRTMLFFCLPKNANWVRGSHPALPAMRVELMSIPRNILYSEGSNYITRNYVFEGFFFCCCLWSNTLNTLRYIPDHVFFLHVTTRLLT